MSDNGRGGPPDGWAGQGGPGHGQQVPPPHQGGGWYGQGPQQGYPQQQPGYGQPYGGQPQGWPGQPPTATLPGGPPPGGPQPGWGGAQPPPPGYNAPPRRRGPIIIAIVAVLALAGGAFGVVTWLSGRGGTATPAAAVVALAEDLNSQNLIDAASRLHPAEAQLAADAGDVLVDELVRLRILKPEADLSLGSIEFKDLQIDEAAAEQVRDDLVINKVTGGQIVSQQGLGDLPFTEEFAQRAFPDGMVPTTSAPTTVDLAEQIAQGGEPLRLASVEVGGEWYVSLFYTAADYGLRAEGKQWPAQAVPAVGTDSAEAAVQETVQAMLDQDMRRLIELMDPAELQVVHDAGEVIIESAETSAPSGAKLLELETTETTVRGHTAVQLKRAVIEADGSRGTIERDGDCLVATEDGGAPQRICSADILDSLGDSGDPTLERIAPRVVQAIFDVQIVTNEVDGKHYFSPGQTVISLFGSALGVLEPEDVVALLEAAN